MDSKPAEYKDSITEAPRYVNLKYQYTKHTKRIKENKQYKKQNTPDVREVRFSPKISPKSCPPFPTSTLTPK